MGVNFSGISVGGQDPIPTGNPVPCLFRLGRVEQIGPHTLACIDYFGVKNYEGRKIILYLDTDAGAVKKAKEIDPHFTDDERATLRPFARFEPTTAGWAAARLVAEAANVLTTQEESHG